MSFMAIDPGLQATGYAIWDQHYVPMICGVLSGPKGPDWMKRVDVIALAVRDLVRRYSVTSILCEQMELFGTSMSRMAWSTGDLQRTVFLCGMIHGMTVKRVTKFDLVPPRTWKGQLPKSVTIRRVTKALGAKTCRELNIQTHAWDAVGMGLWKMGRIS